MKYIPAFLTCASLAAINLRGETNLDLGTPELNNPNPKLCGVILDLPPQVQHNSDDDQDVGPGHGKWDIYDLPSLEDDDLRPITVTGTADPTGGQLSLAVIQGAEKINGLLWLDSEKRQPATVLTWPVAASSTFSVTLFIEGYLVSKEWNDVRLRAAISCPGGVGADGKTYLPAHAEDLKQTSVVRRCGIVMKPEFDNPKWFYAAKVDNGPKCVARAQYVVTWKPHQAMGVFDPGGAPQENLQPLLGIPRPGECRMLYVGPRLGRRWVTKAFWCYYNDPCGVRPGLLGPSDMATGWALLGSGGPVGNPNKKGPGGDPPPPIPPPVPEEDPPGGDGGGSVRDFETAWEPFDNPDIRDPEPPLPEAEEVEIVAEIIAFDHSKTGFRQYSEPLEGVPVKYFLKETAATSLAGGNPESPVGGSATREAHRMTGQIIYTNVQGNPSYYGIDTIPAGATVAETSFTGTFQVDSYDDPPNARQDEPGTMGVSAILADEYTLSTLKQDVFDNAWTFRDIFRQEPAAAHLDVSDNQESVSYAKLRYKIRVPERYPRPYDVSWVEEFTPEDDDPEDGVEPEKEYFIKTAAVTELDSQSFDIDPAGMPDKEGSWRVYLLKIEANAIKWDSAAEKYSPLGAAIPNSDIVPELSIAVISTVKEGNGFRVGVTVQYQDRYGEMPGAPSNDVLDFYLNGDKVGQVTGLSAPAEGNPITPWQVRTSRRSVNYEFLVPAMPGTVSLSVRTATDTDGDFGTASTGVVLDSQLEGATVPADRIPEFSVNGDLDSALPDTIAVAFPGGTPSVLLESGPASLNFTGLTTVTGVIQPVTLRIENDQVAQNRALSGILDIGDPIESYMLTALEDTPGSGSYVTSMIRRRMYVSPDHLPTIHMAGPLEPTVTDLIEVVFPGNTGVLFQETEIDSRIFAAEAQVAGRLTPVSVSIGAITEWSVNSREVFDGKVHIGSASSFYFSSQETAENSGEFVVEQSEPLPTGPQSVVLAGTDETIIASGGAPIAFVLRLKVPKFVAERLESNDGIGLWIGGEERKAERNPAFIPDEIEDPDFPIVYVVNDDGPIIFSMRDGIDGVESTPQGYLLSSEFDISIRSGSETVWKYSYRLLTPDDDETTPPPMVATYEQQVRGWYLAMFGPYGKALLESFEGIGGTVCYKPLLWGRYDCSNYIQLMWDRGFRPEICIDRFSPKLNPMESAEALYAGLREIFLTSGVEADQIRRARPDPWPPSELLLDATESKRWTDQAMGQMLALASILEDFRIAAELGVGIACTPLDVILSVADASDHIREGRVKIGLAMGVLGVLPIVGDVAKRLDLPLLVVPAKGVARSSAAAVFDSMSKGAEYLKMGDRVSAMREFRALLESGDMTAQHIDLLNNMGLLYVRRNWEKTGDNIYLKETSYTILENGIAKRINFAKPPGFHTHHDFPLEFEMEFLRRGLDPNDGELGGEFIRMDFHGGVIHGGQKAVEFGMKGGAWNWQWRAFFLEYPDATAEKIFEFRDKLWARVKIEPLPKSVWDVDWPYPPPINVGAVE